MSNVRFTIELPQEDAETMREIARLSQQPIETVIAEMIQHSQYNNETIDTQLKQVQNYSSIRLWAMIQAGLGFPPMLDAQMLVLIQKSKDGTIFDKEHEELEDLRELYDKYVLLRTDALVELQERGYDIQNYLKETAPKL